MFIRKGCAYYFWDSNLQAVGKVWIKSTSKTSFEFTYRRKRYSASYEYAQGRLFSDIRQVPVPPDTSLPDLDSTVDDFIDYDHRL